MNKKIGVLFSTIVLLVTPFLIFAQTTNPATTWIQGIFSRFLGVILWPIFIGGIIIMLIWAGFLFITANGDPTKIATARKAAIWTVIGIGVGIFAYSAYSIISSIIVPPPV